jgi:alkanesulfonate monooxygenase SsuD/methylene tetrahydromethanopterin reductase-like flavin-dependent oxidoreductase (luciferase family)
VQQGDPIQTAKLLASLDQVSNGRFLFGVNDGGNQDEMEDRSRATTFCWSSTAGPP